MKFDVNVSGMEEVMRRFRHFHDDATKDAIDNTVETYARKMAADAAHNAPVRDGFLKNSLASSPQQVTKMTWEFGSDLPYALRQEYEHATRKGFVRKSLWANRDAYRKAVIKRIIEGK